MRALDVVFEITIQNIPVLARSFRLDDAVSIVVVFMHCANPSCSEILLVHFAKHSTLGRWYNVP